MELLYSLSATVINDRVTYMDLYRALTERIVGSEKVWPSMCA